MSSQVDRVVVVGSGSAGRRHASELRRQCPDAEITVVKRSSTAAVPDNLADLEIRLTDSLSLAASMNPDVVVVAGAATSHVDDASVFLDANAVMIEKPLGVSVADVERLAGLAPAAANVLVGYHLRFHRTVRALAEIVASGAVGEVHAFRFGVGQHLSQWRPGTDPTRSVTANVHLGGGVLLELSHELDAVRFILGDVERCTAELGYGGAPTDGVVETEADLKLTLGSGVSGEVHLDMTSEAPFRIWMLEGPAGTISADLLSGDITLEATHQMDERGTKPERLFEGTDRARALAETELITHLLAVARGTVRPACSVADGLAALAIVDAARRSAEAGGATARVSRTETVGQ